MGNKFLLGFVRSFSLKSAFVDPSDRVRHTGPHNCGAGLIRLFSAFSWKKKVFSVLCWFQPEYHGAPYPSPHLEKDWLIQSLHGLTLICTKIKFEGGSIMEALYKMLKCLLCELNISIMPRLFNLK